jgi:dephospho-CoA kinase
MSLVVGLTGGIGSGKSAAADEFARLGAAVVDTDAIAHELTAPGGAAIAELRRAFGDEFIAPNGALDRARMRDLVFRSLEDKKRLEVLLHPMIRAESERRIRAALAAGAPYAVHVVPLLVESPGYRERVDRVLVVDLPEPLQLARVRQRSGLAEHEVRRIIASQAPREKRLAAADDVIDNSGTISALQQRVAELHPQYLLRAAGKR